MRILATLTLALSLILSPLSTPMAKAETLRILVMGDSLMAWNRASGRSVGKVLAQETGASVKESAVVAASHLYPLPITGAMGLRIGAQFRGGPWDYVVMNGGGNDLMLGCGCGACTGTLNRMISADGRSGVIPELVAKIRATGAKVIYTGYLRTPGLTSPVEGCTAIGNKFDARLAKMAKAQDGVTFVSLAKIVTEDGDRSYHDKDLVHPSPKGSAAIAKKIAALIGG